MTNGRDGREMARLMFDHSTFNQQNWDLGKKGIGIYVNQQKTVLTMHETRQLDD